MSLTRLLSFRSVNFITKYSSLFRRCYSEKNLDLAGSAIQNYLRCLIKEYETLRTQNRKTAEETQRLFEIKPIVNLIEERITLFESIESLKQLNKKDQDDPEIKKMIKEEAQLYLKRMKEMDSDLESTLLEPYYTDGGVLIEVTAGAGGQESMLFAKELFEMYHAYADYKDWNVDIAAIEVSDLGGIRKASMLINGLGAPQLMKIEAGVHRVQRIPSTEKGGRIHTSTVSVAVLPQPTDVEVEIPDKDITIETKRASGAGGQHVNTTDSAVRIVHIPTGTTVECQEGRSQIKNRQIALQKLRTLLLQKQINDQSSKVKAERKSQIGSGERNEKIRTYNYPQDRITEHRPGGGTMHNLKSFLSGNEELESIQLGLLRQQRHDRLMEEIKEYSQKENVETAGKS